MQTVIKKDREMKVIDIVEKFGLKVFSGKKGLENEVTTGYVSDLLSDVLGNAQENSIWITLQTHQNVLAIASLKDLAAVLLVNGLEPDKETIVHSENEGIPVLGTTKTTFEIAGELFNVLNK